VENEDPGIYARIRTATRKINILNLTKDDVKSAYDTHVLEPGHDSAEEEEYEPPNPISIIFFLKNKRPQLWNEKLTIAGNADGEIKVIFENMPRPE